MLHDNLKSHWLLTIDFLFLTCKFMTDKRRCIQSAKGVQWLGLSVVLWSLFQQDTWQEWV